MPSQDLLNLEILVDPNAKGHTLGAICFETGLTREEVANPEIYAYEHHGEGFNPSCPGALTCFMEDVLLGRPLPLKFITPHLKLDTVFAITLFLHRNLAIHPALPGIVSQVDLTHRWGLPLYAHIDSDLTRFFGLLTAMVIQPMGKEEQGEVLKVVVEWVHDYILNGNLPHLGSEPPHPQILNTGSNGFVFASQDAHLHAGWVELYRQGFLRGFLISQEDETGRRQVLASRKSVYVDFNLTKASRILNEMESAMGEFPDWEADHLWLRSPEHGTFLLPSQMMEVFLRV